MELLWEFNELHATQSQWVESSVKSTASGTSLLDMKLGPNT